MCVCTHIFRFLTTPLCYYTQYLENMLGKKVYVLTLSSNDFLLSRNYLDFYTYPFPRHFLKAITPWSQVWVIWQAGGEGVNHKGTYIVRGIQQIRKQNQKIHLFCCLLSPIEIPKGSRNFSTYIYVRTIILGFSETERVCPLYSEEMAILSRKDWFKIIVVEGSALEFSR